MYKLQFHFFFLFMSKLLIFEYFRFKEVALDKLPVGRFGDPDELSNLACYLLSDYSSFITGEV